jgi:hypothetical protein
MEIKKGKAIICVVGILFPGRKDLGDGVFVLFSSMCEQKVSTYMPSWALLVMTAVCKEVRKKTIELFNKN